MVLPLDLLEQTLNARMQFLLKDGRALEGRLVGYDQYMNLVLEDAEERTPGRERKLGTLVLRGNNLISVAQPSPVSTRSEGSH